MIEIYNDETLPGKRIRADAMVTSDAVFRARSDGEYVIHASKENLRKQIAAAVADDAFTFEQIAIADALHIRGDVVVITPADLRAALVEAYNKGRRHTGASAFR